MFIPEFTPVQNIADHAPRTWLVVLHGIYGRGANWRTFARKLSMACPDVGLLLVDLRMHGKSQSAPGPHTVAACAEDVLALIDRQTAEGRDIGGVIGHSFGGKVALEMRRLRPQVGPLWSIDSTPSATQQPVENTVVSVLEMLKTLPERFASRQDFVASVTEKGFPPMLAQWLAMNLVADPDRGDFRFGLDTDAMDQLLNDYFQLDSWDVVQNASSAIHFAVASKGSSLSSADLQRLEALSLGNQFIHVHKVAGGHWLHVDALDTLVELLSSHR